MTRRTFGAFALPSAMSFGQAGPLTAQEVLNRIKQKVGVPWREVTWDTIKTSNPQQAVKGIATSFTSTMEVLEKANAKGLNMVIVHEPTYYSNDDKREGVDGAVYAAKSGFLEKNGMAVMRFHDHWHARRPDGILVGMVETLGWEKYQDKNEPRRFAVPATTLEKFSGGIAERVGIQTMRVIGDRKMEVKNVALSPGFLSLQPFVKTMERDEVDVLVVGEIREWEGVEYVRDAAALGKKKAVVIMGHSMSEDGGMKECAKWLKTFIPEVPVEFIASGEPFWRP